MHSSLSQPEPVALRELVFLPIQNITGGITIYPNNGEPAWKGGPKTSLNRASWVKPNCVGGEELVHFHLGRLGLNASIPVKDKEGNVNDASGITRSRALWDGLRIAAPVKCRPNIHMVATWATAWNKIRIP